MIQAWPMINLLLHSGTTHKAVNLNTLKPSTGLSNWLRRARNRMQQEEPSAEDNIKRALDPVTAAARAGAPASVGFF